MSKALKKQNLITIFIFFFFNLTVFIGFLKSGNVLSGNFSFLVDDLSNTVPAAISLLFVGVLNHVISPLMKFRIVFLRWKNPMPGSRAFTKFLNEDSRIDTNLIREKYNELPDHPKEQNSLWYRWFKSVENHELINDIHKSFLLFRDTTTISLMLLLLLPVIALTYGVEMKSLIFYLFFLALQFTIVLLAARDRGIRLVTSVIALKCVDE